MFQQKPECKDKCTETYCQYWCRTYEECLRTEETRKGVKEMVTSKEKVLEDLKLSIAEIEKVKGVTPEKKNLAADCVRNAIMWLRREGE